jgi:hypothetical protein
MEEETLDADIKEIRGSKRSNKVGKRIKFNLPNAQNVHLLGIIAIPTMFLYLTGILFAVMAIVRYKKDLPLYHSDPVKYEVSFKKLRKGYVLAMVSLGIGVLMILSLVVLIAVNS